MEQVKAIPVCPDCNCVMFKKIVQYHTKPMEGWSCPECFVTRWE